MLDRLKPTLRRLRFSLSRKADDAYEERDAATTSQEQAYAEGKAQAFAKSSDEVRQAEKDSE